MFDRGKPLAGLVAAFPWATVRGLVPLAAILCPLALPTEAYAGSELSFLQTQLADAQWQKKAPGIERLTTPAALEGSFAAYRLVQDKVMARVLGPLQPSGNTAEEVANASNAIMAINGGFFWIKSDGALAPTGLLIVGGAKLASLRKCQACTGVLYSDAMGLHIVRPAVFASKRGVESALQAGPMLVEAGHVLTFNPDGPVAPRTAVCATPDSITVVVSIRPMTLYDLAALLLAKHTDGGFDCTQALNLDGGSSSQLAADLPGGKDRLGFSARVQNFLAFFQR